MENYTSLGRIVGQDRTYGVNVESFFDCLYFSAATYTSLGLGDLVPTHDMRMLVGAEVLNGLVMIGWTISFTYLTMKVLASAAPKTQQAPTLTGLCRLANFSYFAARFRAAAADVSTTLHFRIAETFTGLRTSLADISAGSAFGSM